MIYNSQSQLTAWSERTFQQKLSHYDSTLSYSTQLEIEKQDKQTEEWKLKRNAQRSSASAEKIRQDKT